MAHPIVRKPRRRTPVQPPGRGLRAASISTGHSAYLPLRAHPLHLRSAPSPMRGLTARLPAQRAAKSAPRRIRRCLPAARGAARRLFRSRRRDALGGRRLRRLCVSASDSRLAVPTSSPSASHAGGVPPWARREWRRRRIRGETRRGARRADWTDVRPPGLRAQPGAGVARRCERADGRAPGGEADLSPQPPPTPHHGIPRKRTGYRSKLESAFFIRDDGVYFSYLKSQSASESQP